MKAFIFDTETTWFTVKWWRLDEQPYIIQFAWILGEISKEKWFKEIERVNFLIKPRISIPFASSQVNGIYDKDVENAPFVEEIFDEILRYLNTSDVIVGHNVEFDEEVVKHELERAWRKWDYQPSKIVCTMRSSTDFCQLQWRGISFKPPKLNELHLKLFWERFSWAHNAMIDVEATTRIFEELVKKWIIELEENNVMRLF